MAAYNVSPVNMFIKPTAPAHSIYHNPSANHHATVGVKKILIAFLLLGSIHFSFAQKAPFDSLYARQMVDTLASPYLLGRGYYREGDEKAANIIATEFYKNKVEPFQKLNYYQQFHFSVNTFPHTVNVSLDGKALKPGADFIISAGCPTYVGTHKVIAADSNTFNKPKKLAKFLKKQYANYFVLFNLKGVKVESTKKLLQKIIATNSIGAAGIAEVKPKLTWDISTTVSPFPGVEILSSAITKYPKTISLDVQNKFLADYTGRNVAGFVKGTEKPDSFLVFSAHYDHLGIMGHEAIFTGANDNASGCAMLLSLAKYYAAHPAKYSIAFIAFGGEELGLLGSFHYVEKPMFPLSKIRFLVNLDILGTGDDGITVVNGSVFKDRFDTLVSLNNQYNLLKQVKIRGKAANSDHYPFTEKGVPSFFIYTMGGIQAYHDIYDRRETLPLNHFPQLFTLLTEFVKTFH